MNLQYIENNHSLKFIIFQHRSSAFEARMAELSARAECSRMRTENSELRAVKQDLQNKLQLADDEKIHLNQSLLAAEKHSMELSATLDVVQTNLPTQVCMPTQVIVHP